MTLLDATVLALQNKLPLIEKFDKEEADELAAYGFYYVDVYKVCMDTYSGKRLYLAQNNPYVGKWQNAKTYEWQFAPEGAMEFDTKEEAEKFAKKYFKNFTGWYIYKTTSVR